MHSTIDSSTHGDFFFAISAPFLSQGICGKPSVRLFEKSSEKITKFDWLNEVAICCDEPTNSQVAGKGDTRRTSCELRRI